MKSLRPTIDRLLDRLAAAQIGGYHDGGDVASEPIAWATIALAQGGRTEAAEVGARWLADQQADNGSVGVTESEAEPGWPTALAMLAWQAVDSSTYADRIRCGAEWALAQEPWVAPGDRVLGHDTMIEGWSWAPETHSWLEPTAFFAVALREGPYADHPRRREAIRLLVDRLLPSGGANYGNTIVLGQELLQHVQSSGVAAWALAGENVEDERFGRTLDYLKQAIQQPTGVASLAWAARGLAMHGEADNAVAQALIDAVPRAESAGGIHKTALLALAAQSVAEQPDTQLAVAR
ncbi:MAG: hypothetical protein AAF266_14220 [Planctomycetota bacterium]